MLEQEITRIHAKLAEYRNAGKKMFISSSFQTHSIPLLHLVAEFDKNIPVYFLNTGFHFPETLLFRDEVAKMLDLYLINIESQTPKISQRDQHGRFYFVSDPDRCCYLNKVLPLEPILETHDIWINGVRSEQTNFRKNLNEEEPGAFDTTRYHPILHWTSKMIWEYRKMHGLPEHPLEAKGYLSIGCAPCTRKWSESNSERDGRWSGMTKEECGIHTEFRVK